jgi:far upstream element-binding protein
MPSAIAAARGAIDRIIANEGTGRVGGGFMGGPGGGGGGGGMGGGGGGGGGGGAGGGFFEMMVPGHKVGLIIGKGGEMIKQLQEQSGAKIVIIQDTPDAALEKPLRITGGPDSVETAKSLVEDILAQNDDRDGGFGGRGRGRGGFR